MRVNKTISCCDLADGEIHRLTPRHQHDDVRGFYGHTVWLGNAAEVRRKAPRRQKNDHRDADLTAGFDAQRRLSQGAPF